MPNFKSVFNWMSQKHRKEEEHRRQQEKEQIQREKERLEKEILTWLEENFYAYEEQYGTDAHEIALDICYKLNLLPEGDTLVPEWIVIEVENFLRRQGKY